MLGYFSHLRRFLIAVVVVLATAGHAFGSIHLCNESDKRVQFAIVYREGISGYFNDEWKAKGYLEVAPGDCTKITLGWGSGTPVRAEGRIRIALFDGSNFVSPTYAGRRSSRRNDDDSEGSVRGEDVGLCVARRNFDFSVTGVSRFQDCKDQDKVTFNVSFSQTSNVQELTIYVNNTGFETSVKSKTTR